MQKSSISDGQGLNVTLLDYGARICSIDFQGSAMALTYENPEHYLGDQYYLGASVGPIANRIKNGQLVVQGTTLQMPRNEGKNCLHSGGEASFDKQTWQIQSQQHDRICYRLEYDMSRVGLLGKLTIEAVYEVKNSCLSLNYRTHCDTTCYINPTNHVYFNLNSDLSDCKDISNHLFSISADSYVVVDDHNLPTGEIKQIPQPWSYSLGNSTNPAFSRCCDHHFNISESKQGAVNPMLSAISPSSGIQLDVSSNCPGFQFYTGEFLNQPFAKSAGFCVETQLAPNAINQPNFYAPLLLANEEREQLTHFQFSRRQ